jgi:hypothetical protein
MEAGNNLSKADDADPYGSGTSVLQIYNYLAANPGESAENLCGLLQAAGISWKSYQEDTDLLTTAGNNVNVTSGTNDLTNTVAPANLWSVPLQSFSGTGSAHYVNRYNETALYNFACKHDGALFFVPTNGSTLTTANYANSNPETLHYAPLQQLALDLSGTACAAYNIITPDLYNDMHTALPAGITYSGTGGLGHGTLYTGASAQVAQGDNFLRIVVPLIQASPQYKAGGMIVLWTDESEGTTENDFNHAMMEIVISPYAKGTGYKSTLNYTHSSDVATLQEIFGLVANSPTGYLGDAANLSNSSGAYAGVGDGKGSAGFGTGGTFGGGQAPDLSDLFVANTIPAGLPALRTSASGYTVNQGGATESQTVTVTNTMSSAIATPIYLEAAYLNTTLANSAGSTTTEQPIGSPYVQVAASGLASGESASVVLTFNVPAGNAPISDSLSAFTTPGTP